MSPSEPPSSKPAYEIEAATLNAQQQKAYDSKGHCVVLAGPGSGKTKTLTIKMTRMLSEDVIRPRGAACITYTRACAKELKRRLDRLGIGESRRIFIGTVHSFCFQQIVIPFGKPKAYLEERRLFYVGVTRAKREIHLLHSGWFIRGSSIKQWGSSEFLVEIQKLTA